jgi:hypothetical protein
VVKSGEISSLLCIYSRRLKISNAKVCGRSIELKIVFSTNLYRR